MMIGMDLPWKVLVSGLKDGATITDNVVPISVAPDGYTFSCADAGKADAATIGHYHVELDHALVNMYCTPTTSISLQNVNAGPHILTVIPATNAHDEVTKAAISVNFIYQPAKLLTAIVAAVNPGTPAIKILSPAPGSSVSGDFTVTVDVKNFTVSEALFGKPNLAGYGHWHLNVDSLTSGMMGRGTMLGMSGSNTFQASTKGLPAGPHTFFAVLVDNQHAPLNPAVVASVELVVK